MISQEQALMETDRDKAIAVFMMVAWTTCTLQGYPARHAVQQEMCPNAGPASLSDQDPRLDGASVLRVA